VSFTAATSLAFYLPDSDQRKCYRDVSPYDEIPCAGTGQDGAYSINPLSYTDNGDGTVTDNNTDLVWQKLDDGKTYNWYQATGTYDAASNPTNVDACGSFGRLPSKKELMSIVDYAIPYPGPAIHPVFSSARASYYWASTLGADPPNGAYCVRFDDGGVFNYNQADAHYVRCVRGTRAPNPILTDGGNGTVADSRTGLTWQQAEPGAKTWAAALSYCEGLDLGGATDWRLPNIKELESLIDEVKWMPAIDTGKFPSANSSYYWSSSTYAGNPSVGRFVTFSYGSVGTGSKNSAFDVRCVRGGRSGPPTLKFDDIASPQSVGSPFSVTVAAKDTTGQVLIEVNGVVSLSCNLGMVSPDEITLVNGVGTATVTIDSPGNKVVITAAGNGISGASNSFTVNGESLALGNLSGIVKNNLGESLTGALVYLDDDVTTPSSLSTSSSYGFYSFGDLACGTYSLWATFSSVAGSFETDRTAVSIPCGGSPVTQDLRIDFHSMSGLTPIVLIPGIMGSSMRDGILYPSLPKEPIHWDSEKWPKSKPYGLHDPLGLAGWSDLLDKLQSLDYEIGSTLFPFPYDWRRSIEDVAVDDLKAAIGEAKSRSLKDKVNIIAHSMGGLVVRAYIKRYGGADIDKLAMVGTPNHGAVTPYYMFEGGDPALADIENADGVIDALLQFYTRTVNATYRKMTGEPIYDPKCGLETSSGCLYYYLDVQHPRRNPTEIRDFIRAKVPSVGQLVATRDFLMAESLPRYGKEINTWLNDLNRDFDFNGVSAMVFAGQSKSTLAYLGVNKESVNVYEHGAPDGNPTRATAGDGTVLQMSASIPGADFNGSRAGKHAGLISTYMCDTQGGDAGYLNFVTGNLYPDCKTAYVAGADSGALAAGGRGTLFVQVLGRVSPYLTSPSGEKSGINPVSRFGEHGIPGTSLAVDMDAGSITVANAVDGTYSLELGGERREDYAVSFSYFDGVDAYQAEYWGFNNGGKNITFTLHAAERPSIGVEEHPVPPQGLLAEPLEGAGLTTRLLWAAHPDPAVTGYRIYGRRLDEPKFALLGECIAPSFDTADPWAGDATVPNRIYAVTAVNPDGSESFFSRLEENNDRDHDGLRDAMETMIGTNPSVADSDGDGLGDLDEFRNGSDPLEPLSPPRALPDGASVLDGTPVEIDVLANDSGAAGAVLAIGSVVQQPSHGTAVVSGTRILYTSELNYSGADVFTYTASDGRVTGNDATVTLTVQRNPVALLPITPGTWEQGSRQTISWHGTVDTGKVGIQLFKGAVLKATLSAGTINNGMFAWTVPASMTLGTDYRIKIAWLGNPSLINAWSGQFAVGSPTLTVGQPDGSAAVQKGSLQRIAWGGPAGGSVKIELLQGTVLKATISASTPNDGIFDWVVPPTVPLGNYAARVTWLANPTVTGHSTSFDIVPTTGALEVSQPDAREIGKQGAVMQIRWGGIPAAGNVKILLYQGAVLRATISGSTPNDGSFDWTVPPTLAPGSYQVRVTWLSNSTYTGVGASFPIVPPVLTVLQPTGGSLQRGSLQAITWSVPNGGNVKIQLYQGAVLKATIAASTPNDGSLDWVVPSTLALGGNYQVQVTWLANPAVTDKSSTFAIVATMGTLQVTQPDGVLPAKQGASQQILWGGIPPTGAVRILLYQGAVLKGTISANTPNDGLFDWTVPPTLPPGDYTVRVSWISNSAFADESASFTVESPWLAVTTPGGGELQRGSQQTITWSGPARGNVKILLYRGTELKGTVSASTPNDGSFDWVVPNSLALGDNYQVQVTWVANPKVSGKSLAFAVATTAGVLQVTQPDGLAQLEQGAVEQILWKGIPNTGNVKILLDQGAVLKATISTSTPNDGSFDWAVPPSLAPGSYTVRATWLSDGAFTADSAMFDVTAPTMTVNQPAGGQSWDQGTTQTIGWNCGKGFGKVKIELYKGAAFFRLLAASVPNSGSMKIAVPAVLVPSSDYRVKVTWLPNLGITGWSDGLITLR
jgi:pimeloyl-ACP methyl ester carboxylesterase